jgi:hypothetical protein
VNGTRRKLKRREFISLVEREAFSCLRLQEGAVETARDLLLQRRSFRQRQPQPQEPDDEAKESRGVVPKSRSTIVSRVACKVVIGCKSDASST